MDVGDLTAKLKLDTVGFDNAITGVTGSLGKLASGVTSAFGTVTAAVGTAVAGAATAVGSIVTDAVQHFAEFEQLAGGVEKIFDEMDVGQIMADANDAWVNMNLSASQYLAMINDVGAAFAQTMGDQAGYEVAKQGMQAIADYASGTGRNVEELNTKFAMITRSTSSYQSIADQFSGILPATSAAFLEQAQAAGFLGDQYKKLTDVPIAEYQQAVAAMLEQGVTDLGLLGNTAKESVGTISGSFNALKAAWENVLTSIAGGGPDIENALNSLVTAAQNFINNLMPVVSQALQGIATLIQELAPVIAAEIPGLIERIAPMLLDAAMSLVGTLTKALPELVSSIGQSLTKLLPTFMQTVSDLLDTLIEDILPMIIGFAAELIVSLANGIAENAPRISNALIHLIIYMVQTLTNALPQIITAGTAIIAALAQSFADNSSVIIASIIQLINVLLRTIIDNFPTIYMAGMQIILGLVEGLVQNINFLTDTVVELMVLIPQTITEHIGEVLQAAIQIGLAIVKGILLAIPSLLVSIGRVLGIVDKAQRDVDKSSSGITSSISNMVTGASNEISSIDNTLNTLSSNMSSTQSSVSASASAMGNSVRQVTVPIYDSMGQLVGSFKTTQTVAQSASQNISSSASTAQSKTETSTEKILKDNAKIQESFKELNSTTVRPEVDPSRVVEGCSEIITAVNNALKALDKLSGAGGGGGAGFTIAGARAGGGPVTAGQAYMTGELGREIFIPSTNGYVMNHEDTEDFLDSFGSGRQVVININGDVYDDQRSMRNKLRTAMLDVLGEQVAYG